MKKIIAILLVVVMAATMAIGGTMAYLTDRDSAANVFTVGDVTIELNEDFKQGAQLIPGKNIEKKPTVTNTGVNDAWVWVDIAIPTALDGGNDASKNVVHFNYAKESVGEGLWNWLTESGAWRTKETVIDGVNYTVYTVLYETALAAGETTEHPAMVNVYMDPHVDIDPNGDWYWVENGVATSVNWNSNNNNTPAMYVSAYAIQTEGFTTVEEAYAAYGKQWGDKGTEWANSVFTLGNMTAEEVAASEYHTHTTAEGRVNAAAIKEAPEGYIGGVTVVDTSDNTYTFRAVYINGLTQDLTVENCILDGTYAMNVTTKTAGVDLICNNTTFQGWTSFSGFETATFTNCVFTQNSIETQNHVRTYDAATFVGCDFQGTLDIVEDGSVVMTDCTYNGEAITAANVATFFPGVSITVK